MSYTPASVLTALQTNPDVIRAHWQATKAQFKSDLAPAFATQCDAHLALAMCSVVAFEYRPYGGSLARTLINLLNAPQLDCDNYVSLAWELFNIIYPHPGQTKVAAVGWDGGAVGNHAQLQARTPGSPDIYLDPTIGLCVHGFNFVPLCAGIAVQPQWMTSFWSYSPKPNIAAFEPTVRNAFLNASYQTQHLLYLAPGLDFWRGNV
jgi:hypothetical protein